MPDRDASPYFASFNRSRRLRRVFFIAFGVVGLFLVLAALALAASGDLDPSFGSDGVINPGFSVNALAIQPDDKIVVSGDAVARYNPDGTLDFTFGNNGLVATSPAMAAMTLQSDGKIVVAGQRTMIRLNSNGSLDTSFGSSGIIATTTSIDQITDIALTINDQLIIFGKTPNSLAIARYTSTGSRDLSFNGTGEVNTGFMMKRLSRPKWNHPPSAGWQAHCRRNRLRQCDRVNSLQRQWQPGHQFWREWARDHQFKLFRCPGCTSTTRW